MRSIRAFFPAPAEPLVVGELVRDLLDVAKVDLGFHCERAVEQINLFQRRKQISVLVAPVSYTSVTPGFEHNHRPLPVKDNDFT